MKKNLNAFDEQKAAIEDRDSKRVLIGKVVSAFGIKGEVKLVIFSNDPQKIENYSLFDASGKKISLKIRGKKNSQTSGSSGNSSIIAKLDEINDRNAAEKIRGMEIFANRGDFAATKSDEFYYVDLIGLDVIDSNSKKIGKVINVFEHGAGGVLEIEFDAPDAKNNREKIETFPFKNQFFPEVNLQKNFIRIDLPEIITLPEAKS